MVWGRGGGEGGAAGRAQERPTGARGTRNAWLAGEQCAHLFLLRSLTAPPPKPHPNPQKQWQERDTRLRERAGSTAPRCHFFSTFFMNKCVAMPLERAWLGAAPLSPAA